MRDWYVLSMRLDCRTYLTCNAIVQDTALGTLQAIQEYLSNRAKSGNGLVLNVSPRNFPSALDKLHEYILHRMEEGLVSAGAEAK